MPTPDAVIKSFSAFEVKDADKGIVEAIVCTFDVVDKDGDIIRPGAIADGSKVSMSSYGHDAVWGNAPVGKGTIVSDGNTAVFKGRMFLSTARGRETFETLKEMGTEQEWSFGFRIMGSEVPDEDTRKQGAFRILTKLDAFEVSPVIIGAGVGTQTLAVKQGELELEPEPDPATESARLEGERLAREADAINADAARMFKRGIPR